jgi:hypothetical protein
MIRGNLGSGLCFDSDLHVVDDEVDFNTTGQAPVTQSGECFGVGVMSAQFMENPVLESFAVVRARASSPRLARWLTTPMSAKKNLGAVMTRRLGRLTYAGSQRLNSYLRGFGNSP